MPFQYDTYRSDLTGTIADLMTRGDRARADAARQSGAAQARAAEIRGQNSAAMAQGIGQAVSGSIGAIMQERRDAPRRELEALQLDEAKRTVAEDKALRELFSTGIPKAEQLFQVVGPKRGSEILKGFSALRADQFKEGNEVRQTVGQMAGAILALPETMRAEAYATARQNLLTRGLKPEDVPEQYSPEMLTQAHQWALSPDKQQDVLHPKPVSVAPGSTLINPNDPAGKPLYTAPSRPVSVAPGSTLVNPDDPKGKPVYTAPVKEEHSPAFKEWTDAKANGYTGSFTQYQTEDANRKRPVVNISNQPAQGDFEKTGEDFLKTIPIQWRATVKKIAAYEEDPTKSVGMRSGMRDKVIQWVNQVNPGYKADEFAIRAPTRKAFTTGTQGQQINAINTAIGHIDQITGLADKLQNGGFVPGNAAFNAVRTMFGSDKVTNFDTLKDALAGEVASVLAKGGATVSGIAEAKEKINGANSPQQLAGYVKTLIPVMGSKLASLDYQYHQAMGPNDAYSALSPESKRILEKHGFDPAHPTIEGGANHSTGGAPGMPSYADYLKSKGGR